MDIFLHFARFRASNKQIFTGWAKNVSLFIVAITLFRANPFFK